MSKIVNINCRLRPLRMVFLVRVEDRESLRKIFEINTCLWGGRFNGIIPVFDRTPRWWTNKPFGKISANEIIEGYLNAFEPDIVILTQPEPNLKFSLPKERVLNIEEVIAEGSDKNFSTGLSVFNYYKGLYEQEFQFVRRYPLNVVYPVSKHDPYSLFITACFGNFPSSKNLGYFKKAFKEAFDAKDLFIDESNLLDTIQGGGTPLHMSWYGLNIRRMPRSIGYILFFMDATQPKDLIDYWNLRALGMRVLPIPKQWSMALTDKCISFIEKYGIPIQENPRTDQEIMLLKSRSINNQEFKSFGQQIQVQKISSFFMQYWYPRIWDKRARQYDHVWRCEVYSIEKEIESSLEDGWLSFRELAPSFKDNKNLSINPEWANVIQIRSYSHSDELAQVLPQDINRLDQLFETYKENVRSTYSEGITVLSSFREKTNRWKLPDGFSVFQKWLEEQNYKAELSDKGRIALQLIRSLGGLFGVGMICHKDILDLLNNMSHSNVEINSDEPDVEVKKHARGRIINREKLLGILLRVNDNNKNRALKHFKSLLERRVFRIGLELQCTKCIQRNWFSLDQITEELICERCMQKFKFPLSEPPEKAWCYRTQGPFSIENYAQGSYTVSLALRFLVVLFHAETTWVPSIKMIDSKGKELEFDFGIWWRRAIFDTDKPLLLLGECKSFNEFKKEDLQRASRLAENFPGAVLVFATLQPNLNIQEKKLIASFAKKHRGSIKNGKWKNPIMVLTSHELINSDSPPRCWEGMDSKFTQLIKGYHGYKGLEELCDATCQIHLGMESYAEWEKKEFDKLNLKYKQKKDKNSR